MTIAVVDAGANFGAFARMDGAGLGLLGISVRKAQIACFFDMPTGVISGLITLPGGEIVKDADTPLLGPLACRPAPSRTMLRWCRLA